MLFQVDILVGDVLQQIALERRSSKQGIKERIMVRAANGAEGWVRLLSCCGIAWGSIALQFYAY